MYNRESVSGRRDRGLGEFFFSLSNSGDEQVSRRLRGPVVPRIELYLSAGTGSGGQGGDLHDPLVLDGLEGNGEDVAILPPAGREQQNTHAAAAAVDLRDNTL